MKTLTLCVEKTHGFYLIQTTDDAGKLVDICDLSGESTSAKLTWEALAVVGEHDDTDSPWVNDIFWTTVDAAIVWLLGNRSVKTAWQACKEAYAGMLNAREMAEYFREIRRDIAPAAQGPVDEANSVKEEKIAYAVYQSGYAVFGVGSTQDAAIASALPWLDADDDGDDPDITPISGGFGEESGGLYVRACSQALAEEVEANGGDVAYDIDEEGILRLSTELEDEA